MRVLRHDEARRRRMRAPGPATFDRRVDAPGQGIRPRSPRPRARACGVGLGSSLRTRGSPASTVPTHLALSVDTAGADHGVHQVATFGGSPPIASCIVAMSNSWGGFAEKARIRALPLFELRTARSMGAAAVSSFTHQVSVFGPSGRPPSQSRGPRAASSRRPRRPCRASVHGARHRTRGHRRPCSGEHVEDRLRISQLRGQSLGVIRSAHGAILPALEMRCRMAVGFVTYRRPFPVSARPRVVTAMRPRRPRYSSSARKSLRLLIERAWHNRDSGTGPFSCR